MKLTNAAVAFIVGALILFAGISYVGEHEEHAAQALTHAQAAVDAGPKGYGQRCSSTCETGSGTR